MSGAKIKTACILILAAINLLLLSFVIVDSRREDKALELELEQLRALYADYGVTLADGISILPSLPTVENARDSELERYFIQYFLDRSEVEDIGDGAFIYTSVQGYGTAVFRSDGTFTIQLVPDGSTERSETWLNRVLSMAGIETTSISKTETGFVAVQEHDGTEITNCRIEFIYEGGDLVTVSGNIATNFDGGTESMSCVTAMTRFLSMVSSGEASCKIVTSLSPVYRLYISDTGCTLYGVWRIETDSGIYTVNAATGEIITNS